MRQNPFSLYDFLGYVFPGALSMVIIYFFTKLDAVSSLSSIFSKSETFLRTINVNGNLSLIEETVILTILAYVMGHIVAYLSSVTVEKFAIWTYDYPSVFLLHKVPSYHYWRINEDNHREIEIASAQQDFTWPNSYADWIEFIWRIIIGLFLFPLSLCSLILGKALCMKSFFVKPLDDTLKSAIEKNQRKLAESLGITLRTRADFHRVVSHYEYEKQQSHIQKFDNYVALYGFLRALTLIANCATLWITCRYLLPTIPKRGDIDWHLVLVFIMCVGITYIFFMAFMKFYRRYTLENFMCLVIDTSFKEAPQIPYDYVATSSDSSVSHPISPNGTDTNFSSTLTPGTTTEEPPSDDQTPSE